MKRFVNAFLLITTAGAILVTLPLILQRQFQTDEFLFATSINMFNLPSASRFHEVINFYMIPLSALVAPFKTTTSILLALRFIFFSIFLIGLTLLAGSIKADKTTKLLAYLFVFFHHAFWQFGTELRHDTLLFTAIISNYLIQSKLFRDPNRKNVILLALLYGFMASTAYKGLIYALMFFSVSGAVLLRAQGPKIALRICASVALFSAGAFGFTLLAYALTDSLPDYLQMMRDYITETGSSMRLSTFDFLGRMVIHAPVTFTFLVTSLLILIKRKRITDVQLYALGTFVGMTVLYFLNPAPFQYNTPCFLAVTLILIFSIFEGNLRPSLGAAALAIHTIFFLYYAGTDPYLKVSAGKQIEYIQAAESLTDERHPILDGVGMVATRPPVDRDWQIYNAKVQAYHEWKIKSFAQIMREHAPPVVITNYRWQWLREEDFKTLGEHYLRLAREFWVLGFRTDGGSGEFSVLRKGNYLLKCENCPKIDGKAMSRSVIEFEEGNHTYDAPEFFSLSWVGPRAKELPKFQVNPHDDLIISTL